MKRFIEFKSSINENSLYDATTKTAFLADKKKILDAFYINFFGFLGLFSVSHQRGKMKTYPVTDKQLQHQNIGDDNHDFSLVIKLAHDAGVIPTTVVTEMTKLLALIKQQKLTSKDLDESKVRGMLDKMHYQVHKPSPKVYHVIQNFHENKADLIHVAKFFYQIAKLPEFKPLTKEFRDVALTYYFDKPKDVGPHLDLAGPHHYPVSIAPIAPTVPGTTPIAKPVAAPAKPVAQATKASSTTVAHVQGETPEFYKELAMCLNGFDMNRVFKKYGVDKEKFKSSYTMSTDTGPRAFVAHAYSVEKFKGGATIDSKWAVTGPGVLLTPVLRSTVYKNMISGNPNSNKGFYAALNDSKVISKELSFSDKRDMFNKFFEAWATRVVNSKFTSTEKFIQELNFIEDFMIIKGDNFSRKDVCTIAKSVIYNKGAGNIVPFMMLISAIYSPATNSTYTSPLKQLLNDYKIKYIDISSNILIVSQKGTPLYNWMVQSSDVFNKLNFNLFTDKIIENYIDGTILQSNDIDNFITTTPDSMPMVVDAFFNVVKQKGILVYNGVISVLGTRYVANDALATVVGTRMYDDLKSWSDEEIMSLKFPMRYLRIEASSNHYPISLKVFKLMFERHLKNAPLYDFISKLNAIIHDRVLDANVDDVISIDDIVENLMKYKSELFVTFRTMADNIKNKFSTETHSKLLKLLHDDFISIANPNENYEYRYYFVEEIVGLFERTNKSPDDVRVFNSIVRAMKPVFISQLSIKRDRIFKYLSKETIDFIANDFISSDIITRVSGSNCELHVDCVRQSGLIQKLKDSVMAIDFNYKGAALIIKTMKIFNEPKFSAELVSKTTSLLGNYKYFDSVIEQLVPTSKESIDLKSIQAIIQHAEKHIQSTDLKGQTKTRFYEALGHWIMTAHEFDPSIDDAIYQKMPATMRTNVAKYVTTSGFTKIALNKILGDGVLIKPEVVIDESRIAAIMKYNKITVRAPSAKQSKSLNDLKLVKDSIHSTLKDLAVTETTPSDVSKLERLSVEWDKFNRYKHGDIACKILKSFDVAIPIQTSGQAEFLTEFPQSKMISPAFHGTGTVAASMILRHGFALVKSGDALVTGRMLGDGIYFSNVIDKVTQYASDSGFTRGKGTKGYIFVMDAALGKHRTHYRCAGTGTVEDERRTVSPEWAVFDPNRQLKITKAFYIEIIPKSEMDEMKKRIKLNETVFQIKEFSEFKRRGETMNHASTYTFMDGTIPVSKDKAVPFEEFKPERFGPHVRLDWSGVGPMVVIDNPDETTAYCIRYTDKFMEGLEDEAANQFELYLKLLNQK